jgi:hypothetical protein
MSNNTNGYDDVTSLVWSSIIGTLVPALGIFIAALI